MYTHSPAGTLLLFSSSPCTCKLISDKPAAAAAFHKDRTISVGYICIRIWQYKARLVVDQSASLSTTSNHAEPKGWPRLWKYAHGTLMIYSFVMLLGAGVSFPLRSVFSSFHSKLSKLFPEPWMIINPARVIRDFDMWWLHLLAKCFPHF